MAARGGDRPDGIQRGRSVIGILWRRRACRRWCAAQRTRLHALAPRVVWVRDGDKVPWAFWGAEHGFFELEWAYHLPYLRAVSTQA